MKKFMFSILMLGLAACAASGVKVDPDKVETLQKGKTTYGEVIRDFGNPTGRTVMGNGQKVLTYSYFATQIHPETFIPIVGAFVGGMDHEMNLFSLTFDEKGVLSDYSSTASGAGSARNLASPSQERKDVRVVE